MPSVLDLLVQVQLIDERQHDAVVSRSSSQSGGHLVAQVAEMGFASEGAIARAISVELGLPRLDFNVTSPEPGALSLLEARVCADRFVLPVALRENDQLLWLAMADPTDAESIARVSRRTGRRVRPAVAGPNEILRAIRSLYAASPAEAAEAAAVAANRGPSPVAGASPTAQRAAAAARASRIADPGPAEDDGGEFIIGVEGEDSPLARLAAQLGVDVPSSFSSRAPRAAGELPPVEIDLSASDPGIPALTGERRGPSLGALEIERMPSSARSLTNPAQRPVKAPAPAPPGPHAAVSVRPATLTATEREAVRDLLRGALDPVPLPALDGLDALSPADEATLRALRQSLEKGAQILRAVALLCVEKRVFTREEMKRQR